MVAKQTRTPLQEDELDPGDPRVIYPQRVGVSSKGMISTQHYLATDAGIEMFNKGGNAFDAAVAAAFALGVVEPAASGLGGQTMINLFHAGSKRKLVLDGASRAPNRVMDCETTKEQRLHGHKASTVPSTPAVLAYVLKNYGTMSLAEVLSPAIKYAKEGYRISPLQYYLTRRELPKLKNGSAGQFFLKNGRPIPIGTIFKQPVLAETLSRIANHGIEDFYLGETAQAIHRDMCANGGFIRDDDLAQIPWPIERRPLTTHYGSWRVFTFGPPGAGRALIEALNILSQFPLEQRDPDTPKGALLLAHAIRKANLDRNDRPDDPTLFAQELELGQDITHLEYAEKISKRIKSRIRSGGDTTHLSVMDKEGNAIGLTQSIERVYGSFEASPETGFIYNNYMSAFETQDMSHPYYLRPNAVPWASVAPTLVFKGSKPWMVLGSPGSERIVSCILQVLLRLERGATPFNAVEAPRLHCSIAGKVSMEGTRMRDDIPPLLKKYGFTVDIRDPYSFYLGSVQLVMSQKKGFIGVADPRRDGSAGGPTD
jgi:gamma-glutamyltranspeptidase/glutathione hydrolase